MDRRINEFAQLIIQLRDRSIRECDRDLDPSAQSASAKRWRASGNAPSEIIPDCVDTVIANLLGAIDEGTFRLHFGASDGSVIDLTEVGEGDLCSSFGVHWKHELSTQRAPDDFAEMRQAIEDKFGPKGSAT